MDTHQHEGDAAGPPAEGAPLLGPRRRHPEAGPAAAATASSSSRPRRPAHRTVASMASLAGSLHVPKAHNGETIVTLLCVVLFVIMSSTGFYAMPLTRIIEDVVCRQYYRDHPAELVGSGGGPIDEKFCKLPPIQSDVAFILAVGDSAGSVVSFLVALPWGIVADRIGRKPVVSAALLGLLLQVLWMMMVLWWHTVFPIWTIYIAAGFVFIGGGSAVLVGVILSIVSDVIEEDKRALAFVKIHISGVVGSLLSPSLASLLMRFTGPWPLLWVAQSFLVSGGVLFLFLPETAPRKTVDDDEAAAAAEIPASDLASHVRHVYGRVRESLSILKSPSLVVLLLTALTTTPVSAACSQFMNLFVSKRYDLAIQDTGYVQTAFGAGQVLQGLVLLPAASRYLVAPSTPRPWRRAGERQRDLALARASFGTLALGFVILAAAPTLPLFAAGLAVLALGGGAHSLGRSLMSLYVDPAHRTRLFSLVGMVETVGTTYGPPLLAALFSLGMDLDGLWVGLPYWGIAALCLLALAALFCIRLPPDPHADADAPPAYDGEAGDPEPYHD